MATSVGAQSLERITPGQEWPDRKGEHINAHGGGLLFHEGKYYWYGEIRPARGFTTEVGVEVYSSSDLMNWEDEGVALAVSEEAGHDIERGCIMERPKVVRNPKTGKFVMLFHLELKGKGYAAARVGFAESDAPVGPFRFIRSLRPNAGKWPTDFSRRDIRKAKKLKEKVCDTFHKITGQAEDMLDEAKEKAVDAGKTVADKMADKAFGLAEKTDDFKNKMHAMASEAKK